MFLAALTVAAAASACTEDEPPAPRGQAPGTVSLEGEAANDHGSVHVERSTAVEIEAGEFFFAPTVLTAEPGLTTEVRFRNRGRERHNVSVTELGVDEDVEPGETIEVTVEFPESGVTVMFCKYHRDQGMLGALVAA